MPDETLRLYIALVHYPTYNKRREVVATAITNLDIHDIARLTRTYGGECFFVINPLERQTWLLERIVKHWQVGHGAMTHPNRKEALSLVVPVGTIEEAMERATDLCGARPVLIGTTARNWPGAVSYEEMRRNLSLGGAYMILLGTGWGLTDETLGACDFVLEPIWGRTEYNHLSVRSAAGIILDRLFGRSE